MTPRPIETLHRLIRDQHLAAPKTLVFGWGVLDEALGRTAATLCRGRSCHVVSSPSARRHRDRLHALLEKAGWEVSWQTVPHGEPTAAAVDAATREARAIAPDLIIGLGGGSGIDCAKAVSALATNEGGVEEYLEGVGQGWTLQADPLPYLAIPTTAGTGAEATKNAVIADHTRKYKKSMRDGRMIPDAVILDPALTASVPASTTAAGGLDTITQLIEPCISARQTAATTELALTAIRGCREALLTAYETPEDRNARETLMRAGFSSGVCLANAGLALAHGIASGMGAMCKQPHGLICGVMLPHSLTYNRDACERELAEVLAAFLGEAEADTHTIDEGIETLHRLNRELGLPAHFRHLGWSEDDIRELAERSMGSSMSGNPIEMTPDRIEAFCRPLFLG